MSLAIGSLFSGIGGLELGLEHAGLGHVVWQVEIDPFCRAVLAKHWPSAVRLDDVRRATDLPPVDIVCGGFPCQPVSVAGKRRAQQDDRWLWPEFRRVVKETQPAIVVAENVPGLRTAGLRDVLVDLASLGFDAEWTCLSAADVGAPHLRRRLFIVATHPKRIVVRDEPGWFSRQVGAATATIAADHGGEGVVADADGQGELQQGRPLGEERGWAGDGSVTSRAWTTEPNVGRVAHGVPARVDRLRTLGNAVVPQVAEVIGKAVKAVL